MYNTNHGHIAHDYLTGEKRMDNVYAINGYESRKDYLQQLADGMGIDRQTVFALADLLGETEDFDGLVTSLEDIGNTENSDDWY